MNNAEILNLYKHTIAYKKLRKFSRFSAFMFIFALMMPIITFGAIKLYNEDMDKDYLATVYNYYNPLYSPYVDMGDIAFTSSGYVMLVNKDLEFSYPIVAGNAEIVNGQVNFQIEENILIKASEDGVIKNIGTTSNGTKYIRIHHGNNIESVVENVDIAAIKEGTIVKKGKEIATAKSGEIIVFKIYKDNKQITDYELKDNVIEWKN